MISLAHGEEKVMTQEGRLSQIEAIDKNGNQISLPLKYIPKRDKEGIPIRDSDGQIITEPALSTKNMIAFLGVTHTTAYSYVDNYNAAYPESPIKPYHPLVGREKYYSLDDLKRLKEMLPS